MTNPFGNNYSNMPAGTNNADYERWLDSGWFADPKRCNECGDVFETLVEGLYCVPCNARLEAEDEGA